MLKQLSLSILLVATGLVSGLALSSRAGDTVERLSPAPVAVGTDGTAAPVVPVGNTATTTEPDQTAKPAAPVVATTGPDFTAVAAQTVRAVTNISSIQVVRRPNSPFSNDPFFQQFFGGDPGEMFGYANRYESSLGSGVLISADGYVVTNNHVVGENNAEVTVAVGDRR